MKVKSRLFVAVDIVYILMMILPVLAGIILRVLTKPLAEGIVISGAQIYFTLDTPVQRLPITESQVNSLLVMISITGLCLFLTHGLSVKSTLKRQHFAEFIVEKVEGMVVENMGEYFSNFTPFIVGMLALSGFSSLLSLFGLFPPTSDLNVVSGWAVLVFILITYYKFKCGPIQYLKGFAEPVKFMAPLNLISEIATPISMAFRHYGNVLSGAVISVLVAAGLQGVSSMVLGKLPGFISEIPLLQIGLPAVLSMYFDVFSGCLQAYIFATLTMLYIAGGFPADEYFRRKAKKDEKKKSREAKKELN